MPPFPDNKIFRGPSSSLPPLYHSPDFTTEYQRNLLFYIPTAVLLVGGIVTGLIFLAKTCVGAEDISAIVVHYTTGIHDIIWGFLLLFKEDILLGERNFLKLASWLLFTIVQIIFSFNCRSQEIGACLILAAIHMLVYMSLLTFWRPWKRVEARSYPPIQAQYTYAPGS